MKKIQLILILAFSSILLMGQEIEIRELYKNFTQESRYRPFKAIASGFDISALNKIAVLKGSLLNTGKNTLDKLYGSFWIHANEYGANSFYVDSVWHTSDSICAIISIYNLSSAEIEANQKLHPSNMVYIFGNIDKNNGKERSIRLNNKKTIIKPFEYIAYQNVVGYEAIVAYGGLTGSKVWIVGKENREPMFLSLQGLNVGPNANMSNSVGITINTGKIHTVDQDFGLFLIKLLKRKM
ncbi:MAG: hypothetical protein JEZ09_13430 [Salinivirgaceae bacterium]|nr:hypothetical protein [Salinivirgaceae bacterium]